MSQTTPITFDISGLIPASTGTNEIYSFQSPVEMEDVKSSSEINGKVQIMRIEDGFNAKMYDIDLIVTLQCTQCLKEYSQEIHLFHTERQFYFHPPKHIEDLNDLFLVDNKRQEIDIAPGLRQEIILHFPIIPLCSTGCQGICPYCGQDLNKKRCKCQPPDPRENKPLSALKDLFNH